MTSRSTSAACASGSPGSRAWTGPRSPGTSSPATCPPPSAARAWRMHRRAAGPPRSAPARAWTGPPMCWKPARPAERSAADFEAELEREARQSVKTGFVLDQLAQQEKLGVDAREMSAFVAEQARRMRVDPDRLAKQLADSGQLGSVASEVLRGKALDLIAQRAKVTDEADREVDLRPPASQDTVGEAGEAPVGQDQ